MLGSLLFREKLAPFDWAQERLTISARVSAERPGPLSLVGFEYMREPFEALRDESVHEVFLCWAAQTSKTTFCMISVAWWKAMRPSAMLWALTTKELAKAFVEERMDFFVRAQPWLTAGMRREDFGNYGYKFADCNLRFVGARVSGELSSRAVSLAILDEASKYEHVDKREAAPADLVKVRQKTLAFPKIIHSSTPSTEKHPFWQNWLLTEQKRYFVPCPHCGHMFTLVFSADMLCWSGDKADEILATAHIRCPECKGAMYDVDKPAMMAAGEWRGTANCSNGKMVGYHLNALYSNFETFGKCAVAYWEACVKRGGAHLLQNFKNSYEALPWTPYFARVDENKILSLRKDSHGRGQVPEQAHYLAACYDVGLEQQHWVVVAFVGSGEMWLVDWGTLVAVEQIAEHAKSLSYDGMRPVVGLVDSGYSTRSVYAECAKFGEVLQPSKGSGARQGTHYETYLAEYDSYLVTYSDYQSKLDLYGRRALGRGEGLVLPRDIDNELIAGLSGQVLENKGQSAQWKKVDEDHYGDALKLALITWWVNAEGDLESMRDMSYGKFS